MSMPLFPVILCGGSGTRLWPLSRGLYPKQFMDLGQGRTLFKDTLRRAADEGEIRKSLVVCNEAHRFYAAEGLTDCGMEGLLLLEPAPRNTAPAVALAAHAALELADEGTNPLILVMPSDHAISDSKAFAASIQASRSLAEAGRIVTFGIPPTAPETGYGYIRRGEALGDAGFVVDRFVEKPDANNAARMLAEGDYYWNGGIFFMRADVYLDELNRFAQDIADAVKKAWDHRQIEKNAVFPNREAFISSPSLSIDYAVMEHTAKAAVCPMSTSWSDLGAWESFYQIGDKDAEGNVNAGDILVQGAQNCYLHSSSRLVAALDVENLAVIETKDAVLVASRNSLQQVKDIVAKLNAAGRSECRLHTRVFRPWGSYESLIMGERFQVKRITVNPGERLSLQLHYHRAEHWVVVSGTAEITNGDSVGIYIENQSTYIPPGTKHRLKNPGSLPLVIIEIQSGAYLGEDDIVRFSDDYGRAEGTEGPESVPCAAFDRDVVILSSADWDNPFWTNKQHMAVQFAEHGWRVLYIDSLGLRQPTLHKKDLLRMGRRLLKAFPWPRSARPGIWRASPLVLPLHRDAWVRKLNDAILRLTLRWHMCVLGMKKPLIWTYNPLTAQLCDELPHCGIVYHCVDDLGASPRVDTDSIRQGEAALAKVADICFTTSPALQERMKPLFNNTVYEPNVCEYDLFRAASARELPEPEEIRGIPHPRLLFIGALSEYKVNFALIEEVARRLPDVHWVIIGAQGEGQPGSRKLADMPNLHVLGPKPYSTLPAFMRYADVAVLPATLNAYTESMFPMKFFEYLAAGLQVVSTKLPALKEFEELYFPIENADSFCAAVELVLHGERRDPSLIDSACRRHCWAARFGRMEESLKKWFTEKEHQTTDGTLCQ